MTGRGRVEGRTGWVLILGIYFLVAAAFAFRSSHSLFDFPLDDSWIHRVYARSIAYGQGFAYNSGQQQTGATSPLWVIVTAPPHWLAPLGHGVTIVATKLIGVLFGALSVIALRRTSVNLGMSSLGASVAAVVLALEPRLHFSALSGMEVVLLVWLWLETLRAITSRRPVAALLLLGLAPLARPEAVLLVPFGLLALAITLGRDRQSWPRAWAGLLVVAPAGLWALFCRLVTGRWLPTTFYIKAESASFGPTELRLAWDSVVQFGWASRAVFPVALVIAAGWLVRSRTGQARSALLLLLTAPALYLVGVVGSREVFLFGYYWSRWTDPAALVLTATAAIGIGAMVAAAPRMGEMRRRISDAQGSTRRSALLAAWSVAVLSLVLALPGLLGSLRERRERLATDSRAVRLVNVEPALWIRDNTPAEAVLGVNDAGATRYFGDRRTIDMIGLNNAAIAFDLPEARALKDEVDWIMVFPRVFRDQGLERFFDIRQAFGIPYEEYTVCPCPGQNANVVASRRADEPGSDG